MTESEAKRFSEALAFAAEKHAEQRRKDGTPYILHPVKVAMLLAEKNYDVRYQIVGLFHDLLEDTETTEAELKEFCDEEMLRAVRLVTKTEGQPEEGYIDRILADPMARAVKNADRIDNLRDLFHSDNKNFKERYRNETATYFLEKFSPELDALYYEMIQEDR